MPNPDQIIVLHDIPLDTYYGGAVRSVNILNILRHLLNRDVIIYILSSDGDDDFLRDTGHEFNEKIIGKPFLLRKIRNAYLCMFPTLIKEQLRRSELASLNPKIVYFEFPYMGYATLKILNFPGSSTFKIYDAQNIESNYYQNYFDFLPLKYKMLKRIEAIEQYVSHKSDLIFVTSKEEMEIFENKYGVNKKKLVFVPNGVDTSMIKPLTYDNKSTLKERIGWGYRHHALFVGSDMKANVGAIRWIVNYLARRLPNVAFIFIGKVCRHLDSTSPNVKKLGVVSSSEKNTFLQMCDIALNPVSFGAGTSLKMIEYLAAGMPIITTKIGARGLDLVNNESAIIDDNMENFSRYITDIIENSSLRRKLETNARAKAEQFDWRQISLNIKQSLQDKV